MTRFHEGQDVEVYTPGRYASSDVTEWRKAKIVIPPGKLPGLVQFPDRTRGVFDAEHIRVVSP